MLMIAISAATLTGCDDDENIAYNLEGVWEGDMYMQSRYNGRVYKASYSVLAFDKNPYRYAQGTGYWIDYYSNAPWDYYSSRIEWRVRNERIEILSVKENRYYYISDYYMDGGYFNGYISDGDRTQHFRLRKTASPNWNDYDWNGYDFDYDYYYAPALKKASAGTPSMPEREVAE